MDVTESPYASIGRTIKAARTLLGLRQTELAERANVSLWQVRSWEQGRTQPTATQLATVARALDVTTDALVYGSVLV